VFEIYIYLLFDFSYFPLYLIVSLHFFFTNKCVRKLAYYIKECRVARQEVIILIKE